MLISAQAYAGSRWVPSGADGPTESQAGSRVRFVTISRYTTAARVDRFPRMTESNGAVDGTPLVVLDKVNKHFGALHVLRDIDLTIHRGEVVVVIGPSGSGKSTLCRAINRLEPIDSGTIAIDGEVLPEEGRKLAQLRSDVGIVFQSFNLFAHKTILDNVTLAPMKVRKKSKAEAREKAMSLLERVGIANQADKYPAQLSGGQQQRVAIARSLAMNPKVMLFDEPTSALDPEMIN